ncbi:MAG: LD-carboxypeptidase [Bacteroidaceae bacterium]
MNSLKFPPFLTPGDTIVIISPAGKIDMAFVKGAIDLLTQWGYKVEVARYTYAHHAGFAGTKAQRLFDLQKALDHPTARAIFCTRGGYGCIHLLEGIDLSLFIKNPKWLIGFSDITCLHSYLQSFNFASIHGVMSRHLATEGADDSCSLYLRDILRGDIPTYRIPSHRLNRTGTATGILRGGNLALLSSMRGTPFDLIPDDSILFVEDIGEAPHAVERMLYNMRIGGFFTKFQAVIVGQFTEYVERESLGRSLYQAIDRLLKPFDFPVVYNFPVGHIKDNRPLINGSYVELKVDSKTTVLSIINPSDRIE